MMEGCDDMLTYGGEFSYVDNSSIGFTRECPTLEQKRKAAKELMGEKYILHPVHMVKRKEK